MKRLALALTLWAQLAAAEVRLTLAGPATALGDGATPVTLQLRGDGGGAPRPEDVVVEATAGSVVKIRAASPEELAIDFLPPRVAEAIEVRIVVKLRRQSGGETLRLQVTPAPLTGDELRSGGPFDLRGPPRLVLGDGAVARIHFRAPPGGAPSVLVSTGQVATPVARADGRMEVVFTPPPTRAPQVAIVAVISHDGARFDWLSIPLDGQLRMTIQSRPFVSVVARVGDASFGPVRADEEGRARLTVIAPPGIATAATVATDRAGNVTRSSLPLDVPPWNRVLPICAVDRLRVLVVRDDGRPAERERLELSADEGKVEPAAAPAPGVYEARYSPRAQTKASGATLRVQLRGAPASSGSCRLPLRGEPPNRLTVALDRSVRRAGDGKPIDVTVELGFAGQGPRSLGEVSLSASVGAVGEVRSLSDERVSATWTLPDRLPPGTKGAVLTARVGTLTATATLELRAAPAETVELTPPPPSTRVPAGGALVLAGRARDRFGNPAPVSHLMARARGRAAIAPVAGEGTFEVRYTAPSSGAATSDTLTVVDGESHTQATVEVPIRPARRPVGLALRGGVLTNFAKVTGPLLVADVELRLPFWRRNLSVELTAAIYGGSDRRPSGGEDVTVMVLAVPILAQLVYQIPLGRAGLRFGGGGGVAIAYTTLTSAGLGSSATTQALPSASGLVGVEVAVGRGRLGLEVAYWYSPLGGGAVSGNAGGLNATVGYRFEP